MTVMLQVGGNGSDPVHTHVGPGSDHGRSITRKGVHMVITDTVNRLGYGQTRVTLEPRGEIDAGSVDAFAEMVGDALRSGIHELDVDLRAVPFMDTAALRVLEQAREVLSASGGHLCLRNPSSEVRRLLSLTAFTPG